MGPSSKFRSRHAPWTACQRIVRLFAAIPHELRQNYWFVFYSERLESKWIMTSAEFIEESHQNKKGKNAGKRSIWFNGNRRDKKTGVVGPNPKPRFERFRQEAFERLLT